MSALSEIQAEQSSRKGFAGPAIDLHVVAPLFWAWFHQNTDKKVMKVFGFYTLKVGDLKPVFVMLFGPDPVAP